MNKFFFVIVGIIVVVLVISVSVNVVIDIIKINVMFKGMSCQEFVDFNLQMMVLVVFWVLNEDEDFKGGDYVDFQEIEMIVVLLVVEFCKKNLQSELSKIKDEIKKEFLK